MLEQTEKLLKFRNELYHLFPYRADALFNLLDALCSSGHQCRSVIELSESPVFSRKYSSITDGIADGLSQVCFSDIEKLVFKTTTKPEQPTLFFVDATPNPRPFARKLPERSMVHSPNPAPGNKPVCVGHQYSLLTMAPAHQEYTNRNWQIPLSVKRVGLDEKSNEAGMQQLLEAIEKHELDDKLTINAGDTLYGTEPCRQAASSKENLVHLFRLANHRNVYCLPCDEERKTKGAGRKKVYGRKVQLSKPQTHPKAESISFMEFTSKRGKSYQAELTLFTNMLFRGSRDFQAENHPFNIVRVIVRDKNNNLVFKRPLWIAAQGKRRHELSTSFIYQAYRQRYDIEHYFRFGKQKLLMDKYQTPDVRHEESWWRITALAYVQLFLASKLADSLPRPWERYLPEFTKDSCQSSKEVNSPSQTQRCFVNILKTIGTPAKVPVPRGKPVGRSAGVTQAHRQVQPINFKSKKSTGHPKKIINQSIENATPKPKSKETECILSMMLFAIRMNNYSTDYTVMQT
jgi:hypothetical protein